MIISDGGRGRQYPERTRRLLEYIVREREVMQDQMDSVEEVKLFSLLRADFIRIDYEEPQHTFVPTGRGEQLVAGTDVDSAVSVEALISRV